MSKAAGHVVKAATNAVKKPSLSSAVDLQKSMIDPTGMGQQMITGKNPFGADSAAQIGLGGQPVRPGFQSLLKTDPTTGLVTDFSLDPKLQTSEILGQQGRDLMKQNAMSTELSPLAQKQMQMQHLQENQNLGQIGKQGNADLASAQGNLARNGGLRSGVGALLQGQNMRDQMMQSQQARQGGLQSRLGIEAQDASMKQGVLQNLTNQDLQSQQYNIGNVLGAKGATDAANLAAYQAQMQAWAANKQGQAIANSAPKGGMLGMLGL